MDELGVTEWEIKAWIVRLGSNPIKTVAHEDRSQPYGMDRAHVFELENGQYALVTESGCSCYDAANADIDLLPNKKSAMSAFEKWKKNQ